MFVILRLFSPTKFFNTKQFSMKAIIIEFFSLIFKPYANFTLVYGWYANCNIVMFVIIGSEIHILYYYTIQGGNVLHIRFHKSMLYLLKNAWQLLSRWLRYELWTSGESIGESKLLKVILTLPPPPLRKGNPADTHLSSSHVFLHWRS